MWLYPWAHTHDAPEDEGVLADLAAQAVETSGWRDGQWSHVLYDASGEVSDTSYGVFRSLSFLPEHGVGHGFHWDYQGMELPGVLTDTAGDFEARLFGGSPALDGQSGTIVDCGLALSPDDCPQDSDGSIALIERGGTSFGDKALNAEEAGAAGAIIYNDRWGHLTGNLGGADVSIPVLGLRQFYGEQLLEAMTEGPVGATLETFVTHSVEDVWDLKLPAYLLTIEAAQEQAARIRGSVTDATSGEPVSASLELEAPIEYSTYDGETWGGVHATSMDVPDDGTFDWHVVPSRQPLVGTPPYELSVDAGNYYPASTSFSIHDYQQVEEVDIELQPLAAVRPPYAGEVRAGATLPFRFETFSPNGERSDVQALEVVLYDNGDEVHRYTSDRSPARGVQRTNVGLYQVNIDTGDLSLDAGDYTVSIEFQHDGGAYEYALPLEVID